MDDIGAIRRREQAATPGPWRAHTTYPHTVWQGPEDADDPGIISTTLAHEVVADAEFIAHARTDVPALLARVDEMERAHQLQQRDLLGTIAERDALMPVVEAAKAWREWYGNTNPSYASACNDLAAAMDRLLAEGGA